MKNRKAIANALRMSSCVAALGWSGGYAEISASRDFFSEDDLVILRLQAGRYILSDGIIGYRSDERTCIAFDDLVGALDFSIITDTAGARGWFIKESRQFELDIEAQTVTVEGKTAPFGPSDIYDDDGLLCITPDAAKAWFNISLAFDFENATMVVSSNEPLPVEEREARKKRRTQIQPTQVTAPLDGKEAATPYQWIGLPVVDASVSSSISDQSKQLNGDLLLTNELFKVSTELYASFNAETGVETLRGSFGRRSNSRSLAGPLKLTEIVAGDITSPQNRLSAGTDLGRGIMLSSFPLDQPDVFNMTELRGELLEGWEVELYRNDVLLDFQSSRPDGRYEFVNVPLLFGRNEFRLAFYGPQGQKREDYKEIFVGESQRKTGSADFLLSVTQQATPLFFEAGALDTPGKGELRLNSRIDYGLSENVTIGAGAASVFFDGERETYIDNSLRFRLGAFSVVADSSINLGGGKAGALAVQTSLGGINFTASHEEFFSYESERAPKQGNAFIKNRSALRADFVLSPSKSFSIPIAATVQQQQNDSGSKLLSGSLRTSTAFGSMSVANELNYSSLQDLDRNTESLTGTTLLSYYAKRLAVRTELAYDIKPIARVTRTTTTVDVPIDDRFGFRFGTGYEFEQKTANFTAGINYRFDNLSVGGFARLSTDGAYEAGINLTASFAKSPKAKKWAASSKNLARSGLIATRAFIDTNSNSVFDGDDTLLENAEFKINGRPAQHTQKADEGVTLITVSPYEPAALSIDMRTIDDPYLIGTKNSESIIVPRPGTITLMDVPLSPSGEVVGTVFLFRNEEDLEMGDVELQLHNTNGEIVSKTASEFDGYFVFERVPFGDYRLSISPEQGARLNFTLKNEHKFSVTQSNDIIENLDVHLIAETPAVPEQVED